MTNNEPKLQVFSIVFLCFVRALPVLAVLLVECQIYPLTNSIWSIVNMSTFTVNVYIAIEHGPVETVSFSTNGIVDLSIIMLVLE